MGRMWRVRSRSLADFAVAFADGWHGGLRGAEDSVGLLFGDALDNAASLASVGKSLGLGKEKGPGSLVKKGTRGLATWR